MRVCALILIAVMLYMVADELGNLRHDYERAHNLPNIALEHK